MKRYILKRLLLMIPMLLGISFILFIIMHIAPGDPASMRYGMNPDINQTARDNFNKIYGLDKPVVTQYFLWLKRLVFLDFGNSFIDDMKVSSKIFAKLPATLILQGSSILLIFIIAIPLGAISAYKKDSIFDKTVTFIVFGGYAMPTFWLALVLIYIFGFKLQIFPISGFQPWYASYLTGFARVKDMLWHLCLPVIVTAFTSIAALVRYTRGSMIDVLNQQYIVYARAKGLSEKRVIFVHALRNALMPVITILGLTLPALISGSFIFETIFAWPGMGRLGYEAIMHYDYPVVMGVAVIATFLTLVGIFLSDIAYAFCDPRIRLDSGGRGD